MVYNSGMTSKEHKICEGLVELLHPNAAEWEADTTDPVHWFITVRQAFVDRVNIDVTFNLDNGSGSFRTLS